MFRYSMTGIHAISADTLDEALAALSAKQSYHTEAARVLRAIKARSGCVGKVFNKSVVPAMSAALPGYRVTYGIAEYTKARQRFLYVVRLSESGEIVHGPQNHWSFTLATADHPRMTAETIAERIAYHTEEAQRYARIAADLPAQVAAYNVAADYLRPIKSAVESAMIRATW